MSTDLTPVPSVLVVEDEMILRMRAVDIVEDAGFNPVEAVNADEAISILEWPAQPVDATQALNLSAGVSNCKVSRGRSFS